MLCRVGFSGRRLSPARVADPSNSANTGIWMNRRLMNPFLPHSCRSPKLANRVGEITVTAAMGSPALTLSIKLRRVSLRAGDWRPTYSRPRPDCLSTFSFLFMKVY